jgi:hypothetical protein
LTDDGKTFIETALLGTVVNEANLRGFNRPGCKSIRATLMRALIPLVENKGMSGYSINGELNQAVDIAMQVAINKDKFKNVEEFSLQDNMFENLEPVAVELAKKIESGQKSFAEFMLSMNGGLKIAANGEADIFLGEVESKEDILGRFLTLKKALVDKAVDGALDFFRRLRDGKETFSKKKVLLNRSGDAIEDYRWVADEAPEIPLYYQDVEIITDTSDKVVSKETVFLPKQEMQVQGMDICIENEKGSIRCGTDKDGHQWKCPMNFPYGFIKGAVGCDKEELDAYVGPNPESEKVFIVNQNDPVTGKFDEQKCMIGFNTATEAKEAYLKQYDRPGFFGDMIKMDIDTFKEEAFNEKNKGKTLQKRAA